MKGNENSIENATSFLEWNICMHLFNAVTRHFFFYLFRFFFLFRILLFFCVRCKVFLFHCLCYSSMHLLAGKVHNADIKTEPFHGSNNGTNITIHTVSHTLIKSSELLLHTMSFNGKFFFLLFMFNFSMILMIHPVVVSVMHREWNRSCGKLTNI